MTHLDPFRGPLPPRRDLSIVLNVRNDATRLHTKSIPGTVNLHDHLSKMEGSLAPPALSHGEHMSTRVRGASERRGGEQTPAKRRRRRREV